MPSCPACGSELPQGARFCSVCGAAVDVAPAEGERKLATILFADLVASTALADAEDPERVRARLEQFYDAMSAEISLAGGTVEKFAGDAVMAVFGVPVAFEDHAERALHAALAMRRRLGELFGGELELRIGVNTGDVLAARPREGSALVAGDAVNVAARLEQAAEPGEIVVGERTAAAVRGAFELDEPQVVEAKGKAGGLISRRLVRALSLMRPRGVGGLNRAFVGRDQELAMLQAAYRDAVADRGPRLVSIVGDAGIGKTRLVRELWQWLAEQHPQPLQRTGRCLSYGQIPYWALGEVLKEHFGILEGDSLEHVRGSLGARSILGLALGLDVAGDLHPLVARDRFQDAWGALLEELTAERPAALLIEDLHWAEEPLLELVAHLLGAVRGPLLLIGTARPELLEAQPGFAARGVCITLDPLARETADDLLEQLLGASPPERLRDVAARAEGNPFFLEEMLASLVDQGLLARRNGGWGLEELPAGFVLPDTVQAVVAARIDLLQPADKAALQAASVIGRTFWSGPVYELAASAEADLQTLEERDLVRRRFGSSIEGEREYAFKHALTREVAYAGIPKARRAHLHAAFAAWIESSSGRLDEHAPLLAHHYAEAARSEDADLVWAGNEAELERLRAKAIGWLRRAAELAVGRYEIDEALAQLERALALARDEGELLSIWRAVGHAQALRYDGDGFAAAMKEALELATDPLELAEIYADLALETRLRAGMWRKSPDPRTVEGWIDRALELAAPKSTARLKALIARCYESPGDSATTREAHALAEEIGDPALRSAAWDTRALAAWSEQQYGEAMAWAQRRFDVIDAVSEPDSVADTFQTMVPIAVALGRFREARRLARQHDELARELTSHHRVHGTAVQLEVEELAGSWQAVADLRARAEENVDANRDTPCVRNPRSLLVCAVAEHVLGNDAEARRLEEGALENWMEGYGLRLESPRVRLALLRGDLESVERLLAAGTGMSRQTWFFQPAKAAQLDGLAALRDRARVELETAELLKPGFYLEPFALRALGIVRADASLIEQAQERFRALGLDWYGAQTKSLLAL